MYQKFGKRCLDIFVSACTLLVLSPIFLVLTIVGAVVWHGNPFFCQVRPGKKGKNGKEKLFYLLKFRTMSNAKDAAGKFLPDEERIGKYGAWLRSTSLDELPSVVNVLCGDLSIVGPRPQLVRDMVFMTEEERRRHDVTPGMTGLAQISGRNNITWEEKFCYDLQYIDAGLTFSGDLKIILKTVGKVLKRSDIVQEGTVSGQDFGDWLVSQGKIDEEQYRKKQEEASMLAEV